MNSRKYHLWYLLIFKIISQNIWNLGKNTGRPELIFSGLPVIE